MAAPLLRRAGHILSLSSPVPRSLLPAAASSSPPPSPATVSSPLPPRGAFSPSPPAPPSSRRHLQPKPPAHADSGAPPPWTPRTSPLSCAASPLVCFPAAPQPPSPLHPPPLLRVNGEAKKAGTMELGVLHSDRRWARQICLLLTGKDCHAAASVPPTSLPPRQRFLSLPAAASSSPPPSTVTGSFAPARRLSPRRLLSPPAPPLPPCRHLKASATTSNTRRWTGSASRMERRPTAPRVNPVRRRHGARLLHRLHRDAAPWLSAWVGPLNGLRGIKGVGMAHAISRTPTTTTSVKSIYDSSIAIRL